MGLTSSKTQKPQPISRPYPQRTQKTQKAHPHAYDQPLPPGYWPSIVPNYGYGHPGYMPGAAPGTHAGVPPQYPPYGYPYAPHHPVPMPQPQPYWPQQPPQPTQPVRERPKKRRKKSSAQKPLVATIRFSTSGNTPAQAQIPNNASSAQPAPSTTAHTHFHDESAHDQLRHSADLSRSMSQHNPPRHSADLSRSMTQHNAPISQSSHERHASTQSHAIASSQPAAAFQAPAQTTQPPIPPANQTRPRNPLPEPPRDIYATSPYKHLLTSLNLPSLPQAGQTVVVKQEVNKKPKKGLFSALSRRKSTSKDIQEVRYVYLPPQGTTSYTGLGAPSATTSLASHPPVSPVEPPPIARAPSPSHTAAQSYRASMSRHPTPEPEIEPIYFNQDTEYAPFLNHSPDKVCYERVDYPTATHLLEALKFMPLHPNIADLIRTCEDTAEVYHISAEHAEQQNPDYGPSYLNTMEMVVYLKFNQHSDLRDLLMSTEDAPLVYDDPSDSFWGIGAGLHQEPGQNELGHVMERVRERLRRDRKR